MGQGSSVVNHRYPEVIDPATGEQQYYQVNCCVFDGVTKNPQGMSRPYSSDASPRSNKAFGTTEVQSFHPFIVQYVKLLSDNLNNDFHDEFASDTTMERFHALSPEMKEAAYHMTKGINLLLQKAKVGKGLETLHHQRFAEALSGLLVTSIAENTQQIVDLAAQGKISGPENRSDMPLFCSPRDYFYLDSVKMTKPFLRSPYDRLKQFEPFILDNSIRESTVAQQRGHVKSDKYAILNAVEEVGIRNIIVGAFGELPRVEDDWLEELHREGKMKPNFWAFSELRDDVIGGKPSKDVPNGLQKIIKYQIPNAIFEFDVLCNQTDWCEWHNGTWKTEDHCDLMKQRILTLKKNVSSESKCFFNYRDAVKAFLHPPAARRLVEFTVYLAKLPRDIRPMGLLFEEPAGDAFPWQIRYVARCLRKAMDDNDWKDGHLLIHVHKNYGFCEAVMQEALAFGCTGIWGGISEEGAGVGTGNSLLTLTNLARMGNQIVKNSYDFPRMYHAAKEICLITTGQEPHPKTELYGSRAMDILWNQSVMGTSDFDLSLFFDVPSNIRISTFTSPAMFRQHLANTFGNHPEDWEMEIAEAMRRQLHDDLLSEEKFNYQTPAGLYDLYMRAGGKKFLREMIDIVLQKTNKESNNNVADDHPLMKELKTMYDLYASPDGRMTYKNFFYCFINRFISCFNFPCAKFVAVVGAIDVDKSGDIDWPEISVWAKWAIDEYNLTAENCDIDRLTHLVFVGHIFPVAFQNLYQVKVRSKKHIAQIMAQGDED